MRIRSNLTSRNLYSDSRRAEDAAPGAKPLRRYPGRFSRTPQRSSAGRRIFRLGLMLVLVLLLMQRAADPELYRRIFGALGASLDGPVAAVQQADIAASQPERANAAAAEKSPLTATVAALDDEQLDQLSALLAARRRGEEPEQGPKATERAEAVEGAEAVEEADAVEEEVPQSLLRTLAEAAMASGEIDSDALVAVLRSPEAADPEGIVGRLQAALDARYWTTVSDASVWQPGDADAFYRLLEMKPPYGEPPTRVGYAVLAAQPQVYRGHVVSLEGYAVRIEPQRAAENPFGVERYWLVWIRPVDGSERPVMVYTSRLPAALERLAPEQTLADEQTLVDGPRIVAEGTFLKRHLYRSQRGSELAPVIIGAIGETEAAAGGPTIALPAGPLDAEGVQDRVEPPRWWLAGVIAAVVVPIVVTLGLGWQASRTSRKQREIRARGMPDAPFIAPGDRPRDAV